MFCNTGFSKVCVKHILKHKKKTSRLDNITYSKYYNLFELFIISLTKTQKDITTS